MTRSGYPVRADVGRLVTEVVLRRKRSLLAGNARLLIRDRATPLDLSDPRPFDRALRSHMQTVLSRKEICSCPG